MRVLSHVVSITAAGPHVPLWQELAELSLSSLHSQVCPQCLDASLSVANVLLHVIPLHVVPASDARGDWLCQRASLCRVWRGSSPGATSSFLRLREHVGHSRRRRMSNMSNTDANHCSYSRSRSCQNVAMSFLLFLAQLRCTWQQGLHIHALSARFGQHTSLSMSHSARLTQHASLSTPHSVRLAAHLRTCTAHASHGSPGKAQHACSHHACQSVRECAPPLLLFSILFSHLLPERDPS